MQPLEDFRIFFNHTIHPELMRLDRRRRRLLRLLFFSFLVFAAILLFIIYIGELLVTLILILPIVFYLGYLSFRFQRFVSTFKPKVVNLVLDFIDDDPEFGTLTYKAKGKISRDSFMQSRIFGSLPAIYEGEDYISGEIGDIRFEMCELNVREYSRVRNRMNYVFRGAFLHASIKQPIKGTVLIIPHKFKPYLSRAIKSITVKGGKNLTPFIKNERFKTEFLLYASQDANIRELMSAQMLEAILDYRQRTQKEIYFSFIKRDIYIAVTQPKDMLEPKIFQSNVSFDLLREFFEDISILLSIVVDFDKSH